MKKEHTTLFPRSTSVFVIPSLLLRRKKGPFYYFVYTRHTSLLFCFLDFFFHRLYRLSKSVFSRRFFGPFFGGLFLHASSLSLSLSLSLFCCWCCCVCIFFWRQRERKKRRDHRGSTTPPFGVLSPPFSRLVRPKRLSRSSSKFFAFPIFIRFGNHLIGKKKTQTYNDPKERALVHAPPPSNTTNTAQSGVVGSLLSKRGHHHHQR